MFRSFISSSVILLDDDGEAEDLLEEIGLGVHGEALDGGVLEAGEADAELVVGAEDLDLGNALGVGALEGISDAEDGGELADADAVIGGERGVGGVIELRAGVAVVA